MNSPFRVTMLFDAAEHVSVRVSRPPWGRFPVMSPRTGVAEPMIKGVQSLVYNLGSEHTEGSPIDGTIITGQVYFYLGLAPLDSSAREGLCLSLCLDRNQASRRACRGTHRPLPEILAMWVSSLHVVW